MCWWQEFRCNLGDRAVDLADDRRLAVAEGGEECDEVRTIPAFRHEHTIGSSFVAAPLTTELSRWAAPVPVDR